MHSNQLSPSRPQPPISRKAEPSGRLAERGGHPAQRNRIPRLANRLLDVVMALVLLAVLALPMLLIAAAIKLTSRGPVVYKQRRVGLGGKTFVMYKFRSMRNDAEAATGPVWAKRGDLRCTRIGNLLRHWCLDELPQLFNVLNGDMSLVGPRPERPFFVQQFSQQVAGYNQRHTVPPGITGWAQINGWRGDSSLEKRVEFDLFYVHNWSLRFNLQILLLTPLRVLADESGS